MVHKKKKMTIERNGWRESDIFQKFQKKALNHNRWDQWKKVENDFDSELSIYKVSNFLIRKFKFININKKIF